MPEDHLGAPVVGRRVDGRELVGAGGPQADLHRRRDDPGARQADRSARSRARVLDRHVVAALGRERHAAAEALAQSVRPGAGGDDQSVDRMLARRRANGARSVRADIDVVDALGDDLAAICEEALGQRLDDAHRGDDMRRIFEEDSAGELGAQRGFHLTQLIGAEFFESYAVRAAHLPRHVGVGEFGRVAIGVEDAVLAHQVGKIRRIQQFAIGLQRRRVERLERIGDGVDAGSPGVGGETQEPGRQPRQMAPTNGERAERVGQPAR